MVARRVLMTVSRSSVFPGCGAVPKRANRVGLAVFMNNAGFRPRQPDTTEGESLAVLSLALFSAVFRHPASSTALRARDLLQSQSAPTYPWPGSQYFRSCFS
jgi:hypothetical protein